MKNIHILPTNKEQHSIIQKHTGLFLKQTKQKHFSGNKFNLFITNDEEIKDGDWCLDKFNQKWKLEKQKLIAFDSQGIKRFSTDNIAGHECKKIILTTDVDLIKDGVQSIDDEFLEWFVKNPSCEWVKTQLKLPWESSKDEYEIIIPKEEPKQDKIMERFIANAKQQETLEEKLDKIVSKEPSKFWKESDERFKNKETLEEAAQRLIFKTISGNYGITSSNEYDQVDGYFETYNEAYLTIKLKWQMERSYSEEESFENKSLKWWMSLTMDEQVEIGFKYDMPTFNLTLRAIMHEFEQFKKK